jgi:hypothetical protein
MTNDAYAITLETMIEGIRRSLDGSNLVDLPTLEEAHLIATEAMNDLMPALMFASFFPPDGEIIDELFLAIPFAKRVEAMNTLGDLIINYIFLDEPTDEDEGNGRNDDRLPPPPAKNWREYDMLLSYKLICAAYIQLDIAAQNLSPLAVIIKPAVARSKEREAAECRQQIDTRARGAQGPMPCPGGDKF